MSNTELLYKKLVLSAIQFEKDGFTFLDSTEHLMPEIETDWKTSQPLLHHTKRHFLNRFFVRKQDDFASCNSTFD